MPHPPYHRVRARYSFLEREAFEFYWSAPTDRAISIAESYQVWYADHMILLRTIPSIFSLLPDIKRQCGPIMVRKEVIYLVDREENLLGWTTWNRDPNQRLVSLFRLFDPAQVDTIHVLSRSYGCRRSKRRRSIVTMHALQGIIIHAPKGGFAPLVAKPLAP
jgi:hypothetical protein